MNQPQSVAAPRLHTIHNAGAILSLSRSSVYRLINAGELTAVRIGSRATRITADSLDAFVRKLAAREPA